MRKYSPLIRREIDRLGSSHVEVRQAVYARTHKVLMNQLQLLAFDTIQVESERVELQRSILEVEADFGLEVSAAAPDKSDRLPHRYGSRQFAFNAAASWTVNVLKALLQVIMLPVMARLLDPTAYGVYSLAQPVIFFFLMLADGGIGASLSREDESNRVFWSTASWVLLLLCGTMSVLVGASGIVLSWISGQESLRGIMLLLAVVPMIMGVAVPADARLVRRGNLLYHSGGDFAAFATGAAVAVVLAYQGAGAWSLAAQYVANFSVRAIILNVGAWTLPDFIFDISSLRGHVSTGGALLAARIGEMIGRFVENTLFSHLFGTGPLGSFTLANQASRYLTEAVANPLVGAFYAHALHASDSAVSALYLRLIRLILCVLFPIAALSSVVAPVIFPAVLGAKWAAAAPLFEAVMTPYVLLGAASLSPQILLKHGLFERSAGITLLASALRIAVIATGLVGASALMATWLFGLCCAAQSILLVLAVPRSIGATWRDIFAAACAPAISAIVAGVLAYILLRAIEPDLLQTIALSAACLTVYVGVLAVGGGRALRQDVLSLSSVLRRVGK